MGFLLLIIKKRAIFVTVCFGKLLRFKRIKRENYETDSTERDAKGEAVP